MGFKERAKGFFLGTPEEKAATKTLRKLNKIPDSQLTKRQASNRETARRVSRRRVIRQIAIGAGITAASISAVGTYLFLRPHEENTSTAPEGPLSLEFTTQPQTEVDLPVQRVTETIPSEFKEIDRFYLRTLFDSLKQEKSTPEERSKAVFNNTGIIAIALGKGKGTAFMIDEAGYWLTSAHLVASIESGLLDPNPFPPFVHHPNNNTVHQVTSVVYDPFHDVAIAFAPTGKPNKQIEHMQLSDYGLRSGYPLWQIGAQLLSNDEKTFYVRRTILHGHVDDPPFDSDPNYIQGLIRVRGMLPFAGTSGGPIIDNKGCIVGVEDGAYNYPGKIATTPKEYAGSTIAPVKYALELTQKNPYTYSSQK